jgi:hypothetical protein
MRQGYFSARINLQASKPIAAATSIYQAQTIGVLRYVILHAGQHPSSSSLPVRCWHYRPKVAARRASRSRWRRKGGRRQRSGFPRCDCSAGRRRAARGAGFPRGVVAKVENHSCGREGPSAPNPSIRREVPHLEPQRELMPSGPHPRPTFTSVLGVGMRQFAGRSVISRLEHKENKCRVREVENLLAGDASEKKRSC